MTVRTMIVTGTGTGVGKTVVTAAVAALEAGHVLALANKESLVVGGPLVTAAAAAGQIVAVDSEHSALAQCLRGGAPAEVDRLVLTASGGPFRGRARAELADLIQQLTDQMMSAARDLQFELAGRLRDEIADLKKEMRGMDAAGVT